MQLPEDKHETLTVVQKFVNIKQFSLRFEYIETTLKTPLHLFPTWEFNTVNPGGSIEKGAAATLQRVYQSKFHPNDYELKESYEVGVAPDICSKGPHQFTLTVFIGFDFALAKYFDEYKEMVHDPVSCVISATVRNILVRDEEKERASQ